MKTRIWIGSLFLLVVSSCSNAESPRESAVQSVSAADNLALLPQESNFVFYANVAAMRETPFGREFSTELEKEADWEDDEYLEFLEKTGFDLKKDVYEIWFSGTGDKGRYEDSDFGGAIIRGRFDRERIDDYVKRENRYGLREESYRGFTIVLIEERHDQEFAYTFLNSETAVLGKENWVKAVLDLSKKSGQNILSNPLMAKYIREIPRKEHCWGVVNIDEFTDKWAQEVRKHGSSFKGTESLENMKTFIFYTYLDDRADVNLKGVFEKEEEAQLFAEMLTGFKAMAKLMMSDDREAVDMLNEIRINSRGNTISVSSQLSKDFFDKLEQRRRNFGEFKL